jgi:hypothetical protein
MLKRLLAQFYNYIILALLSVIIVLGISLWIKDTALDSCTDGREKDKALYISASNKAAEDHLEALRKKEKDYEAKATKADENYGDLAVKYRDALRLYAKSKSSPGKTVTSAEGGSAESIDGPSTNTLFSVTYGDLQICTDNTARLKAAREWALGLNK